VVAGTELAQKPIVVDGLPYSITPSCGRWAAGVGRSWQLLYGSDQ